MNKVNNFTIVVDSVADLDPLWLDLHPEIVVIPIGITDEHETRFDESATRIKELIYKEDDSVEHSWANDIFNHQFSSIDEFYDHLAAQRERHRLLGTTYAQNMPYIVFESLFEKGDPFLYVGMTSALSSTFMNNCVLIDEFKRAYPEVKAAYIDSRCIAPGYRLLIERLVAQKLSIEDAIAFVASECDKIVHLFTIDSFEQAVAGGRVSATEAFFGKALGIRPYMRFDYTQNRDNDPDEPKYKKQLSVTGRARTERKLFERMANEVVNRISPKRENDPTVRRIIVAHAKAPEKAERFKTMLRQKFADAQIPSEEVEIVDGRVGPVIGAHVGETTLAIFFTANEPSTQERPAWQSYGR